MNRGFLIFRFVLRKESTQADCRRSITEEVVPNTNILEFGTYGEALDKAKELIGYQK